jgi:heme oxygenase
MEDIAKFLEHTKTQVKYFKQLQEASPNRKLNAEIKKLEIRAKVLEELV